MIASSSNLFITSDLSRSEDRDDDDQPQTSKSLRHSRRTPSKLKDLSVSIQDTEIPISNDDMSPSATGLATSIANTPLAISLPTPTRLATRGLASSASVRGESVETGQSLASPPCARDRAMAAGDALVQPAISTNDKGNALNGFEQENAPCATDIAIKQTEPETSTSIPSSVATVATATISMETIAVAKSSSTAALSSKESEELNGNDCSHMNASIGREMTSSAQVKPEAECTSGEQQIVRSSDLRTQLSDEIRPCSSLLDRKAKSVQTDGALEKLDSESQTDDDVTFSCFSAASGQLKQLRLNVYRLLSDRLPLHFSIDRLEEVDAAFERFVIESMDIRHKTPGGTKHQTKYSKKEEEKEQKRFCGGDQSSWTLTPKKTHSESDVTQVNNISSEDDVISVNDSDDDVKPTISKLRSVDDDYDDDDDATSDDDVKHDVSKPFQESDDCESKEDDLKNSTGAKTLKPKEEESLEEECQVVEYRANGGNQVVQERSNWSIRLGLGRPPIHSYPANPRVTMQRSARSTTGDIEAHCSSRSRSDTQMSHSTPSRIKRETNSPGNDEQASSKRQRKGDK